MTAAELAAVVRRYRFSYGRELDLQEALEEALELEGIAFERERPLDRRSRPDFLVGRVGLEAKVKGPPAIVRRQLARYLAHDDIDEVVLVTGKASHQQLAGGPVVVVSLTVSGL